MSSNGKWIRTSFILLLMTLAIILVVIFFRSPSDTKSVDVSTILAHIKTDINNNQKDTLNVSSNTITLTRGAIQDAAKESATINDTFDTTKVLKDRSEEHTSELQSRR